MSKVIETKLIEVYKKLQLSETNIKTSKKNIADALRFNGITNVGDAETFARYAELVRRLKSANAMIFEFTIPETPADGTSGAAMTDYKRTLVLPMYFSSSYTGSVLGQTSNANVMNAIAKEVIANDEGVYPVSVATMELAAANNKVMDITDLHLIKDMYGNTIVDGNYVPEITMDDIEEYLTPEQQEEIRTIMYNPVIKALIADGGEEKFEPDTDATYSFTVDWGDGSEIATFDRRNGRTDEDNKAAIWHTYKQSGTYQVTINGVFKRMYSNTTSFSDLTEGGQKVMDKDGKYVLSSGLNYNMRYGLVSVVAWGNTMLNSMANAFCYCQNLETIPMYDTTNSFIDVTTFENCFRNCTSLKSLPFNENTNKGLFSGCEKATTFASCFYGCSGISGSIPPKLIDGCPMVTSTASMFYNCKSISGKIPVDMIKGLTELKDAGSMFYGCTGIDDELTPNLFDTCPNISSVSAMYQNCTGLRGNIPQEMFKGITTLKDASALFSGCTGLNGEIPNDLFEDCESLTTIANLFSGCTNIIGKIKKGAFSNLRNLANMQRAFRNCSGIEGFEAGAFEHLEADDLVCFEAFENCTGIQEIPDNLLAGITGKNVRIARMFPRCTGITRIGIGNFGGHKPNDARGIFGGCTKLEEVADLTSGTTVSDWEDPEKIKIWFGAFANTAIAKQENTPVCAELGGYGERKTENQVGKIVLADRTMVEIKDFTYDVENPPIAMVYADLYLDKDKMTTELTNGEGNVVPDKAENGVHKIYASVFNDGSKPWTNGQSNAEDITTITNTTDVNVAYSRYTWDEDGNATLNSTRYNGEAYTKAINEWRVSKGMATYQDGKYIKTATDKYDAMDYCLTYKVNDEDYVCFLPDGADLWTQYMLRDLQQMAIDKVIELSNGTFKTSNAYPVRTGTGYWASAESSATHSWNCTTGTAYVTYNYGKWGSILRAPVPRS